MTIILKPFSAPTVQFPQKRKTSYPQSHSTSIFLFYRHYFYIINESLISTSYFTGIILNQFTVLIECNFILLFYLLRVSIRCYCFINLMYNPFVYWLFKRTFGSNTFKLYSAPWWCSTLPILFSGSLKSRDFLCVAGDLSHEATRGVSKILYDVISSTQIPIYNANNNDELMLHFLYTDHLPDILSKPIFLNIILLSWLCVISKNKLLGRY